MNEGGWQITIASDVEADALVAELYRHGEQWATVFDYGPSKVLALQLYPRSAPSRAAEHWDLPLDEALSQLNEAGNRLRDK